GMFSPYQMNPFNINPLETFAKSFFEFERLSHFKDIKLFLCATHVNTGKLKIFRLEDLRVEVLLASACLPFLFQAVEINGEHYWDGGFVGNPAIYPLIYECDTPDVMVIQLTAMHREGLPKTAREIIDRHKEITYNACLMREMRSINFISKLMDDGLLDPKKIKRLNIHLIRNAETFSELEISSALNTDWSFLEHLYNEGRKTGKDWLEQHYDDIGVRTTAQIQQDFVE
ncbi:MAG: patatin-like phospholipase family protein, partial [Alphaproteobacteria bacterium]